MKKALIVLLILAVAGGLFAQTVKVGGTVQAGLGIGISDQEGADKPQIDYVRDRGDTGIRGRVEASFTSADDAAYGQYGAMVHVRGQAGKFVDGGPGFSLSTASIWWTPSPIFRIDIGSNDPGGYGTPGGLDTSNDVRNGDPGIKLNLAPVPGLELGAHMRYGNQALLFENVGYRFGVKYTLPAVFKAVANLKFDPTTKATNDDNATVNFAAGASFLGLGSLVIGADVGGWNFANSKKNYLGIGERVDFTTGPVALMVKAQQFIAMGDTIKTDAIMPMLFRADFNYTATPVVSAGIEGVYVIGRTPSWNFRHAPERGGIDAASFAGKDLAYLAISPRVTFKVGPEIVLGYNLGMDMSKDAKASATAPTMQHLFYAMTNLSF